MYVTRCEGINIVVDIACIYDQLEQELLPFGIDDFPYREASEDVS